MGLYRKTIFWYLPLQKMLERKYVLNRISSVSVDMISVEIRSTKWVWAAKLTTVDWMI